jgi:hypothetical protein
LAGKTQEGVHRTRFLLGGMTEAERERLEAEYFADDDAFQEMLEAEDDLIDAYARGELSPSERRQFEQRFLNSSEGRERMQFARAFAAATVPQAVTARAEVEPTPAPGFFASIFGRPRALQAALATIAVASTVGFSGLLVERSRMNGELHELRAERARLTERAEELQRTAEVERARSAELQAQLDARPAGQQGTPRSVDQLKRNDEVTARRDSPPGQETRDTPSAVPVIVSFDLAPGTTRGGGGNVFPVPGNATRISLRLGFDTEAGHENYRAVIETADGRFVRQINSLRPGRNTPGERAVSVEVPAKDLRPGVYTLFLSGASSNGVFNSVASYSFQIVRKGPFTPAAGKAKTRSNPR